MSRFSGSKITPIILITEIFRQIIILNVQKHVKMTGAPQKRVPVTSDFD